MINSWCQQMTVVKQVDKLMTGTSQSNFQIKHIYYLLDLEVERKLKLGPNA